MTAQRYCVTYKMAPTGTEHVKWARSHKELVQLLGRMVMWDDEVTHIDIHDSRTDFSFFRRWKA